jgi:hypothetical protein
MEMHVLGTDVFANGADGDTAPWDRLGFFRWQKSEIGIGPAMRGVSKRVVGS